MQFKREGLLLGRDQIDSRSAGITQTRTLQPARPDIRCCQRAWLIDRQSRCTYRSTRSTPTQEGYVEEAWVYSSFVRDPCASGRKTAAFLGIGRLRYLPSYEDFFSSVLIGGIPSFDSAGFGLESRGAHSVWRGALDTRPTVMRTTSGRTEWSIHTQGRINPGAPLQGGRLCPELTYRGAHHKRPWSGIWPSILAAEKGWADKTISEYRYPPQQRIPQVCTAWNFARQPVETSW